MNPSKLHLSLNGNPEADWEALQEYLRDQDLREEDDRLSRSEARQLLRTHEPDDINSEPDYE